MKRLIVIYLSLALLLTVKSQLCSAQQKDPVKWAKATNEKKAVDEEVAEFLVKAADARMMGIREGKLATQKGTTLGIKDYGKLMVRDQNMLLSKIKSLAASRKITLPANISDDKNDGFKDLSAKTGEDFDTKFCKMMAIDHKRDIKAFKMATQLKDKGITSFASKQLPLIEAHLEKLKALEK